MEAKGKKRGGATAQTRIARNPLWTSVLNRKEFDQSHTSIVRVNRNDDIYSVFVSHSTDGKTSKESFSFVPRSDVASVILTAAKAVGCSESFASAAAAGFA